MLRAGLGVLLAVCSFGQLQAGIIAGEFGNYQPGSSGTLLSNPSTLASSGYGAFASRIIVGSSNVTVDKAFLFYAGDGSLTKEFSIRADGVNAPSATTLATASINLSGGVAEGTWGTPREHALSTAITLSANTTYWAVAEGGFTTTAPTVAAWAAVNSLSTPPPGVDIASAIAQTVFLSTDNINKGIYTQNASGVWSRSFGSKSLNFQLGTASAGTAAAVPEPGMLSIYGLGALGMLGGFRRGRRKKGTTVAA